MKRDLDTRMDSDRHEIGQLRTSLEIAKSEIRQLRAERAILNGQLEVARGDKPSAQAVEEIEEVRMPAAAYSPLIDISDKSLRSSVDGFMGEREMPGEPMRVPPAE